MVSTLVSNRGVFLYAFPSDRNTEVHFTAQFPHGYKEGTNIRPHVHVVFPTAPSGSGNVVSGLQYTWFGAINDTVPLTQSIEVVGGSGLSNQNYYVHIFDLGNTNGDQQIDGAGMGISSQFVGRLYRQGLDPRDTYDDDVFLVQFDIHYQADSDGSRQEFIK